MKKPPHLAFRNVSHRYGNVLAVDGFSLSLEAGEVLCLLGPSGSGKTTVLRIAAGLERQTEGEFLMHGRVTADPSSCFVSPEQRSVGLMFQDYALFPHLNVFDNVAFGLRGQSTATKRERVMALLAHVGMTEFTDAYPHRLSGGEQQRIALARALAPAPGVMLMDEPFSGLDRQLRNGIRDETRRMLKSAGITTLLVTHDPEEAMRMGDRIALLNQGRLVQVGSPETLFCAPATREVASFFSDFNTLNSVVKDSCVITPAGLIRTEDFPDGTKVTVMIRPSALQVVSPDNAPDDRRIVEAEVVRARFLGEYNLIDVRIDESLWQLSTPAACGEAPLPAVGSRLRLVLDPEQTLLFARETG